MPAGWPHVIGAGVLVVEAQEPTDFSILLEWAGFDLDGVLAGAGALGDQPVSRRYDERHRNPPPTGG